MPVPYPVRKACPACGKPMKAVPDEIANGKLRYVCTNCGDDPLQDPTARKWADSPLRPPAK
jgi:DNA-directed RNA polymerase subunit RPC12/RpoP